MHINETQTTKDWVLSGHFLLKTIVHIKYNNCSNMENNKQNNKSRQKPWVPKFVWFCSTLGPFKLYCDSALFVPTTQSVQEGGMTVSSRLGVGSSPPSIPTGNRWVWVDGECRLWSLACTPGLLSVLAREMSSSCPHEKAPGDDDGWNLNHPIIKPDLK